MVAITGYGPVGPITARSTSADYSSELDELTWAPTEAPFPLEAPDLLHSAVVSTQPVAEPAVAIAGYYMPGFRGDYYDRIHVVPAEIALGNLLSAQTRDVEVWNAYFVGKLLDQITEVSLDGIVLTEPEPAPTTFVALESRIYQVAVSTNGSPVIDGYYTFEFQDDELPTLRITGRRVVIWPFVPQTKFRETLQWLTDVLPSYSAEQRLALREAPRQSLSYDFQLTPYQYSRAKAIATQWAHRVYGAPVWAEATRLGALPAGTTALTFDTRYADYRSNDIVLLWDDDERFAAVETLAVTTGSIELKLPLADSYENAYVMPLRFARTLQGTEFRRDAHDVVQARMVFLVSNNVDLAASIGFPQYRGRDVMMDRSVVLSDMSERITRAVDIFDNGSGVISVDQERAFPDRTESLSMTALTRQEAWRMRQWLHARRGRQKSFWLPSWNQDLIILENVGAGDTSITVRPIGYPLYYGETDIMVILSNGTTLFNHVTAGSTDLGGNEVLIMSGTFGTAFTAASVVMTCFIKHVRFDADQVDLSHGYAGYVSTAVAVREVPEGNP